jgi:hypothetical protein
MRSTVSVYGPCIPRKGIARPQSQFSHSGVCERTIHIFPGSVHIFSCSRIGRPVVGIYKSPNSFSGNICFRIFGIGSLQCAVTAYYSSLRFKTVDNLHLKATATHHSSISATKILPATVSLLVKAVFL